MQKDESVLSTTPARQTAYRRIADGLRDQIIRGQFVPGQRLPSEKQLVGSWKASSFTIHTALQSLIKEGWIESVPNAGTYVAQSTSRFVCAGIYHGADIFSEEETAFTRRIHTSLVEQLRRANKKAWIFMDTRPAKEQNVVFPALADAILRRHIQCLLFPMASGVNMPSLSRLRLPTATMSHLSPNRVSFDLGDLLRQGTRRLAQGGFRKIGLISNILAVPEPRNTPMGSFFTTFRKAVQEQGLTTRNDWIRQPHDYIYAQEMERYGYTQFKKLWTLKEKPDAVVVYSDSVVRGVIMGVLEAGTAEVISRMKFVFHRNAHLQFLCPFPVTWAISDEDLLAQGLIEQIQKQFDGKKTSPVLLPHSFVEFAGDV